MTTSKEVFRASINRAHAWDEIQQLYNDIGSREFHTADDVLNFISQMRRATVTLVDYTKSELDERTGRSVV